MEEAVEIINVSSGSEAAIATGVAKSFLGGGEIGVTLCWVGLVLGPGLHESGVVDMSLVTGGMYKLIKGVGLVSRRVLTASSSSSSSESEERPPSSSY